MKNLARAFGYGDEFTLSSGFKVLANQDCEITRRPQALPCVVQRIEIVGSAPDNWIVKTIRVGNRHVIMVPTMGSRLDKIEMADTVQIAMDFAVVVTYIGFEPEGEVFTARLWGVER